MKARDRLFGIGIALIASALIAAPSYAGNSTAGTKIGVLTCKAIPDTGYNLLIHSTVDIDCKYESTDGSGVEHYIGETGVGLGIDLKMDTVRNLVFGVFALDTKRGSHKLAGKYVGAGGSAAVGVSVGAHALIGGSDKSVSLEPVFEGGEGIGARAGVTYLYLQAK